MKDSTGSLERFLSDSDESGYNISDNIHIPRYMDIVPTDAYTDVGSVSCPSTEDDMCPFLVFVLAF